ncbi:methionine ABC transporter permease [Streptococcus sp. DD13]|uniref:methionine ABC transporter permease n=1 Tax=Streptococcus sp. DD13 TaxID=1777881 RepID=UPI003FA79034
MATFFQQHFPNVIKMGLYDNALLGTEGWLSAIYATLYMTLWGFIWGGLLGLVSGLFLVLTGPRGVLQNRFVFSVLDKIVSLFRAFPFVILLAVIAPVTRSLVGTEFGVQAAVVPLSLSVFPFYARQVQVVLADLDRGVIEAAQASGGTLWDIVKVYLREALPDLIRVTTLTLISLVGYTAMAGAIGAGGLGKVAVSDGYNNFRSDLTLVATLLILVLIFTIQFIGDYFTKKLNHR